jgi:hypothetical protein
VADDVIANAGAGGATFATDQDPGTLKHYPWSKVVWGPDDTFNKLDDASGKRLPIKVGDGLGAASVVSGQIPLSGAESALTNATARRFRIKAHNDNTDVIYLGTTGVTSATGFPLWMGDQIDVEVSNLNVLHAIVGSGTQKICYLGFV